jgi:AcrR family transcriptional regulator
MNVRYSTDRVEPDARTRGDYEPGRKRRALILERATELFATQGFTATSTREIATACGLTPAGLSHHFSDKTAILLELLEMREREGDELQLLLDWRSWLLEIERINRANPILTRLFVVLSAEATDPNHPAHDYFVRRYAKTREKFAGLLAAERQGRRVTQADQRRAEVLIGAWDGLQMQSMLDPSFAMRPAFELAIKLVSARTNSANSATTPPGVNQ